jgi:biopolymer transport protein ExbD
MRRYHRTSLSETGSEIDLTPMIDMVFILLVFFIVSTSFIKEAGVVVERPAAATATAQQAQVVIAVDADNVLWLEGNSVDIRTVPVRMKELLEQNDELSVIVAADVQSNSGVLIKVIDLCRQAGISDVSVATKDP